MTAIVFKNASRLVGLRYCSKVRSETMAKDYCFMTHALPTLKALGDLFSITLKMIQSITKRRECHAVLSRKLTPFYQYTSPKSNQTPA